MLSMKAFVEVLLLSNHNKFWWKIRQIYIWYPLLSRAMGVFRHELAHDKTFKMACAPSKDSDQHGHLPKLISLRCLHEENLVLSYPLYVQWRLWSDWVDAQAVLSLHMVHVLFCRFCYVLAQIFSLISLWKYVVGYCYECLGISICAQDGFMHF